MADLTETIHIKVVTFDPRQNRLIPVPNATILVEDNGLLWDPNLSSGSDRTGADGVAAVAITFAEGKRDKLNPFVTVTLQAADRTVPAGAPSAQQFQLPAEWVTRHYVKRRIPNLLAHDTPENPLEILVGLYAGLRLAYTDFSITGFRNPLALPAETLRVYLADYDEFLWIDALNPDDTLTGVGGDPRTDRIIPTGANDQYPYFDRYPTVPWALLTPPTGPRAVIDPPGAPVGSLGGGSFAKSGPLAVDAHGFVFLIDGNLIRRFYPDGTLCETISGWQSGGVTHTFASPGGLALDQYRNLYVADTGNDRLVALQLRWRDGEEGRYLAAGAAAPQVGSFGAANGLFNQPRGLAVIPNRVVDGNELLAVADSGNQRVQVFRLRIAAGNNVRRTSPMTIRFQHLVSFGAPAGGSGASRATPVAAALWEPVAVAADAQGRLLVADRAWHRISRWTPDHPTNPTSYSHNADWEKSGGLAGNGNREFDTPVAVSHDAKNNTLYVAEAGNERMQRLDAETGNHLLHWTPSFTPALPNPFTPAGVAADARGELYVADSANDRIVRGTTFAVTGAPLADNAEPRLVGTPWLPHSDLSHLLRPSYVTFGPDGKLWVTDRGNGRVLVFAANAAGELHLAPQRITTDLRDPWGVAVTPEGALFVVDSGNHRVRSYDATLAHVADFGTGSAGAGANEFNDPRGIAYTVRNGAPVIYVADRNNHRIKVIAADGTTTDLTAGGSQPLQAPEDIAADAQGNLYIADTGNKRIVQWDATHTFVRAITVTASGLNFLEPCGVAVDDEGKLIVTDRAANRILRVDPVEQMAGAHKVLAFWDLQGLLSMQVGAPDVIYYPDLARQVLFNQPQRAVVNADGLLVVADSGQDRLRLVRVYTALGVNLFELGERLPDISFRTYSDADWRSEIGLGARVTGGNVDDFITDPQEKFSDDRFTLPQTLSRRNINAAANVMKVARFFQQLLAHLTRMDDVVHRWGVTSDRKRTRVKFDLLKQGGSAHPWDDDSFDLGANNSGRGIDAWDDSVIVHEMTHWVVEKAVQPRIPFARAGGQHLLNQLGNENLAFNEAYANFFRFFWGAHFGSADRVRGFPLVGNSPLTTLAIYDSAGVATARVYPFGGPIANPTPTWDAPGVNVGNEAYVANALWQIYQAIAGAGILFADSPGYWYPHNAPVTDAGSTRFVNLLWRALRLFPQNPTAYEFQHGCEQYLKQVLQQAHAAGAEWADLVQTIYALNNLLPPVITLRLASAPATVLGSAIAITAGASEDLVIQLADATGQPLAGYNLHINITSGNPAHYTLPGGVGPTPRHGQPTPAAPAPTDHFRATPANGIVTVHCAPGAGAAGTTETVIITYQPDFDQDATLSPPVKGDDQETTLRRLYLYELRTVAKVWGDVNKNWGARVTATLQINITA